MAVGAINSTSFASFITKDSEEGQIDNPLTLNLYTYCNNNPINFVDPTGHWPEWLDNTLSTIADIPSTVYSSCSDTWNNDVPTTIDYLGSDEAIDAYIDTGLAVAGGRAFREARALVGGGEALAAAGAAEAEGGNVFWSGGNVARSAAEEWAGANNATTLEMTSMGMELEEATAGMAWVEAGPLWDAASQAFAKNASGQVNVFQNAAGVRIDSTWARVEYPTLMENSKVTDIVYHVVK